MVAHLVTDGEQLPSKVQLDGAPAFSPAELRILKAETGRTLEKIMGDECDAMQAMVWLALRDEGYNPGWDDCANVRGIMAVPELDPSTGGD